jgi:hypothetical protein
MRLQATAVRQQGRSVATDYRDQLRDYASKLADVKEYL